LTKNPSKEGLKGKPAIPSPSQTPGGGSFGWRITLWTQDISFIFQK
jgi:hypothetical protein